MASSPHVPSNAADHLDRLEANFAVLKAVLDDPLQLLDRLRELELQRRAAS